VNSGSDSVRLIEYAQRRLLPDVFFHPIWARAVEFDSSPFGQVRSLLDSVEQLLAAGKTCDACQALFVCAFQQLRSGDHAAASNSLQRIYNLAEQYKLPQIGACAVWGAAAICVQLGWYQQAALHLEQLRSLLDQQHEWILSDVIDILRQDVVSRTVVTPADRPLPPDAVPSLVFEQLLHWGATFAVNALGADGSTGHDGHSGTTASAPAAGLARHSLWQMIKHILKGELQLKWVTPDGAVPLHHPEEPPASVPASPIVIAALAPAPPLSSLDQSATVAADQESARPRALVLDQFEPVAKLPAPPSITAYLLGPFSFSVNDATVPSWSGKGRAVFKYLLVHHDQPVLRDVLMDVFWPQAAPESARNSLNVALHGLRQALKTVTVFPVVIFEEGAYGINPEFHVWTDVDEFDRHVQAGRRLEAKEQLARALAEYEAAVELYQGDFLSGDLYEEWPVLTRERLRLAYLDTLDRLSQIYFDQSQYRNCIALCQLALTRDACREDIHCLLMRCYSRQGQRHLALRQYQACVEALRTELDVTPAPTTTQLHERIRRRERV
jgi:DNA-binding SARP family transcriptional activator